VITVRYHVYRSLPFLRFARRHHVQPSLWLYMGRGGPGRLRRANLHLSPQHRIQKLRLHPVSLCVRDTHPQKLQVASLTAPLFLEGRCQGSGARSWLRDDHRRPTRGRRRPVTLCLRWHDPELGRPKVLSFAHCPFRAYLVCPRAGFSRRGRAVTCGAAATPPGRRRRRRCPGTAGPVRRSGRTRW
jgi:hypothetical protein